MDRIRRHAWESVARACGFGALAIFTAAVGAAALPALAAKIGAAGAALMGAILLLKAANALSTPYRKTELWVLLDRDHGLPEAHAQRILMGALKDCYLASARISAVAAAGLWLTGLALGVMGF